MRTLSTLSLALLVGCLLSPPAQAQVRILPYAGYAFDAGYDNGASFLADPTTALDTRGGVLVGVGAAFPILERRFPFDLAVQPSFEATFLPGESRQFEGGESLDFSQFVLRASAEVVGSFPLSGARVVPSLGLGLSYARYAADFDASDGAAVVGNDHVTAWALGPSLTAGLRFGRGSLNPFVQARYRFATPEPNFSSDRPGPDLDNGFSAVAGVSIAL
ncbi:MAG: hypothetical protein ABJF88_00110 [Rhodothermales bacterium]